MENLYFLAITTPAEVGKRIIEIQYDIASRFDSRKSLKVIPHITLKAPFQLPVTAHQFVLNWFENLTISVARFSLELKDFGAFHNKNKPVIFIKPEPNISLMKLQKEVLFNFKSAFPEVSIMNLEIDFHPHLTVAYRDLTLDSFQKAWPEFQEKKFSETFDVYSFHLFKHDGVKWNIIRSFLL
ncbi:2'-5' RNA ligase family protein [Dyadobacter sp. CY356]|uniref:2'-5' RNA ligase family protein n=1 Tax=Dyadobacter sp. CY356 TaxID=2906442 RepID=UPI001F243B1A|nr:2'-5' RNA ligase family protein [Dyadobacter sp. CY356]MCF0057094.1 2'-5' RNA ligase family protein [Dyadobacter sp. CY356]